jgi:hypothetical protein
MKWAVATVLPLIAASSVLADGLTIIDFDQFEFNNALTNNVGNEVSEEGFTFTKANGRAFEYAVYGQQSGNYTGSASLFNNTVNGLIRLEHDNGQPFQMVSIDVANLGGGGPTSVTFTGFKRAGGSVMTTFNHPSTGPVHARFKFPVTFGDLVAVEWNQTSPFHQFDNVAIGRGSSLTKAHDLATNWQPLGPDGTYVYANSFIANDNGVVDQLGCWLEDQDGTGGPGIRFEVWGSKNGDVNQGPDANHVIASTGSLDLIGTTTTARLHSAETEFSGVLREGKAYWFVATCVGEPGGATEWEVGQHTQNTGGINDNGTFWYSNDPTGANFDGQALTPELSFSVVIGRTSNAYYIDRGVFPWGDEAEYSAAMDAAFPKGWVRERYDTVNVTRLFSPDTDFIYMEGSDSSAEELKAFRTANQGVLQAWVDQGGTLLINAAPNEGASFSLGFGPVTLNYPDFGSQGNGVDPDHPIFNGPFTSITANYTGTSFSHATLTGGGIKAIMRNETNGIVLAEKEWGDGAVVFGGYTSPAFHDPDPDSQIQLNQTVAYGATLARGVKIDFDAQEFDNNASNNLGTVISEDGFRLTKGGGEPHDFVVYGTQVANYPGSAAVFNNTVDGLIRLERKDGKPFTLRSIDISPLNGATPVSVTFKGIKADGPASQVVFNHSGCAVAFETLNFPANFQDTVAVEWTQDSPFHQFDNIKVVRPKNVTFDSLKFDDALLHTIGAGKSEDGLSFYNEAGPSFKVFGEQESRYPGSTALFNDFINGVTRVEDALGGAFNARSIDIAPLNGADAVMVDFTGFKQGGGTVMTSFTHTGNAISLETFTFPGSFTNLVALEWLQESPYHQFDNLTVDPATGGPCAADCDGNGTLNILDFVCFQQQWQNQTAFGDCDNNGLYNILDFVCFQVAFQDGCP